jgi:hypothetical protein
VKDLLTCPSAARAAMSVGGILCLEKTLTISGKNGDDTPLYLKNNEQSYLLHWKS